MRILICTILLFTVSIINTLAQTDANTDNNKKKYHVTRISNTPDIDGILDEEVWNLGVWENGFTQNRPYDGRPSSQKTDFKVLFDDNNLYVAIKCYDSSPDSIVNRLTRRDDTDGDLAGVLIDSYHDLRTGFLFGVSAAGVKYDILFTGDGANEDPSWDPNWWVKTSINDEGWVAEMRIPFSQVRFDKNSDDVWGFEVARVIYRHDEQSFWQPISQDAPGIIHLFGELHGLEEIQPRKIFDVTPYGVARTETFKKEPDNPFRSKGKDYGLTGGIDAKIGITNNMTMDLSINPDFGQVEADPSVVNLSAYETYFSEKRPLFIEGNNITSFNLGLGDGDSGNDNLFYSRRIGRRPAGQPHEEDGWYSDIPAFTKILGAAKLTGRTKNGLSVGFIEAVTAEEKAETDTGDERIFQTVEPLTNYTIGRVQKDFGEGNTLLGGIITGTNRVLDDNLGKEMHKSAYTGGLDFTQYFNNKNWMFNISLAMSQVNGTKEAIESTQKSSARYFQRPDNDHTTFDPDRTSLTGTAGKLLLQKQNGHFNIMASSIWKTPGFEANDLGYMQEADRVLSVIWVGYNVWEPKGIYRNYNFGGDIYIVNNFGGDITGKGFEWNGNIDFRNYWSAWGGGNISTSHKSPGMLRGGPMMMMPGSLQYRMGFRTDHRKKLNFNLYGNFTNGFKDHQNSLYSQITITYKPFNSLSVSLNPSYNKSFSNLQYVTQLNYNDEERYIFASIDRKTISASFRVNFNISPDLTLQYWGQPFICSGKYSDHKYITEPMADDYKNRFHIYTNDQKNYNSDNIYIDENVDGTTDYSIEYKDFNIREFLSNLVLRWEYSPGSSLYLVWSQNRNFNNNTGAMDYFNDLGDLFDRDTNVPNNVFLIKFSYRFGFK
jgi:hypothetical protein